MFRRIALLGAMVTMLASAEVKAAPFSFDFDGAGGLAPISNVIGLDWAPGNILAVNSTPLSVGATFTSYYQATLQNLQYGVGGGPSGIPAGREVTIVAAINEQVNSFAGGVANFTVTGGTYSIYAGAANASNLAGTGFNDGVQIMSGTISPTGLNNFSFANNIVAFDQSGSGVAGNALFGVGGVLADATVGSFNSNYFILGNQQFDSTSVNGNNQSFFNTVNPSASFAGAGYLPAPNRGGTNGVSGPDSQFQIDTNQAFALSSTPGNGTPEPISLAVWGSLMVGGATLGVIRRRRVAKVAA